MLSRAKLLPLVFIAGTGLAALLTTNVKAAQTAEQCARIATDSARLECFDLLFRKSTVTSSPANSEWRVTEEKSKIDDSTNVTLSVESREPHTNKYNQSSNLLLAIACRENRTVLFIYFAGEYMAGLNDRVKVTYRIDKRSAERKNFIESNNNEALGLWRGDQSITFIKKLFGGNNLLIRANPWSESAVTAEFNITGLKTAIKPLRRACGW